MHWLSSAVGKVGDTWPMVWVWYEFESHNCLKHLYIDINYRMLCRMQIIQIERKCKFLRMRLKLRYIFLVKVEPRWGLNYRPLGYEFNPITTTLQRLCFGVIADILNITIFITESPPGSRTGANLCLYSPHWSELLRLVTRVDGPNSPHRHTLHVALLIQSEAAQPWA